MAKISDAFPVMDVSIVLNGDISQISTEELDKDKNKAFIENELLKPIIQKVTSS